MKKIVLILSFMLVSLGLQAQTSNDDVIITQRDFKEIIKSVGKNVIVVDSVYSGRTFENHTLLNIGGKYPNQLLTVFIDKKDYKNFQGDILELYLHKKISIEGKVTDYNGKAQIIVTDPKKQVNRYLNSKKGMQEIM